MVDCCVLRIVCDEMSVYELVDDARSTMHDWQRCTSDNECIVFIIAIMLLLLMAAVVLSFVSVFSV